jgi:nitroimidazol reductase NimA-like FMN-containing flavoprotein (pyridoxamine 5'-phosphate oxidase superfamily)
MCPQSVKILRHAERAVPEQAAAILAAGLVAHVGFVAEGRPQVIPMSYHYAPSEPDVLYLHGSPASRLLATLLQGGPACVAVTLLDGVVYSKTAKYHSQNYRSVVCYGRARLVEECARKAKIYEAMISRYTPGRIAGRDYIPATDPDLDASAVVAFEIESWSAKARSGGPKGPQDADENSPGTCGVLRPLHP